MTFLAARLVEVVEWLVIVGNAKSDIDAAVTEACSASLAALHSWAMESCAYGIRSSIVSLY
jgi:hypothetical protein